MKYLDYVNIKQGTDSTPRFSHGNTLPLTALPHSLAAFAPQTNASRGAWWYNPKDCSVEGIRLTHQPSPWVGDFSYFTFMPQSDGSYFDDNQRYSGFRPHETKLFPHYLCVDFLRYQASLSLAPTDTGAVMCIRYADTVSDPRFAVLPSANFAGKTTVDVKKSMIYGYTTSKSHVPTNDDFRCYYVFSFDCAISDVAIDENCAWHACVGLALRDVTVRMAISYISHEQALYNLQKDAANKSFSAQKDVAQRIWEDLLGKIEVEGDEERKHTFYSCLYRAFLYPTKFYETDKDGAAWHIEPETNEIKRGVMYTNNGFWDTYRTVYPLYSLVIPDKLREILIGFLNFYDDMGYLPRWPSPSEFGCMPGTLIEAVFADAIAKDILTGEDARRALHAMLKNARVQSSDRRQGRKCVREYATLGYIPYDLCRESVNETLDCAYGDYCIAAVAQKLGENQIAEEFYERSKNYRNLFDPQSGFMRAKDSRGNFRADFDCFSWGRDYTEGSAWQNSFAVPHDVAGLAKLYGGKDKLIAKMDELFDTPPIFRVGGYGNEIHEMTEMAAVDFGQCAISNQPSFHFPFMFSELGNRNKTIYWVKRLASEVFHSGDDGFPGDEDNGTMACWYIFACLGFYPMCPGRADYTLSEPLFDKININGKTLDSDLFDKAKTKILHWDLMR